jgi:hypothetical protein
VIGWEAQREQSFHELHPIEIKLKNAEVIAQKRWLVPKPLSDYSALEKKIHIGQAIYKSFDRSDQYRFWSDFRLDEMNQITCFTEIPGVSVLGSSSKQLLMEVYGFAMEPDGTIVDFYHLPISLDLTNTNLKERLKRAGLKVWNVLFARQGPLNVRTIVFNSENGQTMTHSSSIQFSDGGFQVTNPFFPSYNFDWVFWPRPNEVLQRRGQEITYPYKVGENIFTPELSPRVQPAEKGKVIYFKMYNFTANEKYPSVRFTLFGENGNSIEIDRFGLMQQPRLVQGGGMELFWRIESIPSSLTKGKYRFQIHVSDRGQNKEVIRDVPTSVD